MDTNRDTAGVSKPILIIEVIVCFGLVFIEWLSALLFLPTQLIFLAAGTTSPEWVLLTVGGLGGLIGMAICIRGLFRQDGQLRQPAIVFSLILAGAASIAYLLSQSLQNGGDLFDSGRYAAPLLCTVHVLYLSRSLFLPNIFGPAAEQ